MLAEKLVYCTVAPWDQQGRFLYAEGLGLGRPHFLGAPWCFLH